MTQDRQRARALWSAAVAQSGLDWYITDTSLVSLGAAAIFPFRHLRAQPMSRRQAERAPRRVSIGTLSMYIECAGPGSPTVVFDAGLGGSARNWEGVIEGVRRDTRACRYDRLGTGRSDAAPRPHTPVDMALELSELLAAMSVIFTFELPWM